MPSKNARRLAREKHLNQKRRAKYKRIIKNYKAAPAYTWKVDDGWSILNGLITELLKLNVKYLQTLLSDLKQDYIVPWSGDYHRMFIHRIELAIMERTLLK